MSRYRHWKNFAQGTDTFFATSTALDFAHVFRDPIHRDLMVASLVEDVRRTQSHLHAFVVMINHIHLLATLSEGLTASDLMRRIKLNSSRRIRKLLAPDIQTQLSIQSGLDQREFWQRGFRSVTIQSPEILFQKCNYIHQNPVRAGLSDVPDLYRWSSSWAYTEGYVDVNRCLDLDFLLAPYAADGLPPIRSR